MLINGRFLTQRVTGVQRFAREILRAACEAAILNENNASLVTPPAADMPPKYAGVPVRQIGLFHGHLWEQTELSAAANDRLLVNLCGTAPCLRRKQLVVLHDAAIAAFPQNFTRSFRLWYRAMIRSYGRRAQWLASVSSFAADDIAARFGLRRDTIEVIPESGEHILLVTPDYSLHEKFALEPDGYFLAVSSRTSTKNFSAVLQAVARLPTLPFKFVIVGGANAKIFHGGRLQDAGAAGAIEVGYVSEGQLRALYERAACFVYPSLYEGFGIPPLEAMSAGCPALVSRAASLPEICGEGAAYCDPYDVGDIARQLARLLGSKQARNELRQAGSARARHWTWHAAAQRLKQITDAAGV